MSTQSPHKLGFTQQNGAFQHIVSVIGIEIQMPECFENEFVLLHLSAPNVEIGEVFQHRRVPNAIVIIVHRIGHHLDIDDRYE